MAKKRWMQAESKREEKAGTKGSFRAWCKRRGYDSVTAECIAEGKRSKDPTTVRRANMAARYASARKRKKRRTQRKEFGAALKKQKPRRRKRRRK